MNEFEEFTEQELRSVNDMHKRQFENLTADEVALLIRWNTAKVAAETRASDEQNRQAQYLQVMMENANRETAAALENLNELKAAALARLGTI